jgi:hypothetical protein
MQMLVQRFCKGVYEFAEMLAREFVDGTRAFNEGRDVVTIGM